MDLKQSTYKSETSCIEGYSLRSGAFNDWMARNGWTNREMAARLGMNKDELTLNLLLQRKFNKEQITRLVRIMGANDALFVLYLDSFEERQRVYYATFGKPLKGNRKGRRKRKQ